MGILHNRFLKTVDLIGMNGLAPVFYNAPVAIRFEIGGDESVYLNDEKSDTFVPNPTYISAAFKKVKKIYESLLHHPRILRIDVYPNECDTQSAIQAICRLSELPAPNEKITEKLRFDENDEPYPRLSLYWDISKTSFNADNLLLEIIRSDIGGFSPLTSAVYFADDIHPLLFHPYDDRGADAAAADTELIRPMYEKLNDYILNHDRAAIDKLFKISTQ